MSNARDRQSRGLSEALRLHRLPRIKPSDADRPAVQPAPGRKIEPLLGQLDLFGNEAGTKPVE